MRALGRSYADMTATVSVLSEAAARAMAAMVTDAPHHGAEIERRRSLPTAAPWMAAPVPARARPTAAADRRALTRHRARAPAAVHPARARHPARAPAAACP